MTLSIPYRHKHALIIGINKYPGDSLKYCINDARDLGTALRCIKFKVICITDCNLDEFYRAIDTFMARVQPEDLAFFYFAGHGKQSENENYLLPSDYAYDYRGHEHDYMAKHAINVKYIMKKIGGRGCRIIIYLFDCCRNLLRTRATTSNQGLLPMSATSESLIVYACAPGKAVLDETKDGLHGSFIEHLLKYIKQSNKDIREIIEIVTREVRLQTGGFQIPQQTSSFTGKVFLATDSHQDFDEPYPTIVARSLLSMETPNLPSSYTVPISSNTLFKETETDLVRRPLKGVPPNGRSLARPYDHEKSVHNSIPILPATTLQIAPAFTGRPKWPVLLSNSTERSRAVPSDRIQIELPVCQREPSTPGQQPRVIGGTSSVPEIGRSNCKHTENRKQVAESHGQSLKQSGDATATKALGNTDKQLRQTGQSTTMKNSVIFDKYFQDDDEEEGNASNESVPVTDTCRIPRVQGKNPTFLRKTRKNTNQLKSDDQSAEQVPNRINTSDKNQPPLNTIQTSAFPLPITDRIEDDNASKDSAIKPHRRGDLTVLVQSLEIRYELRIPVNGTIKQLKDMIWQKINRSVERCQEDSHVLLLFTHRMHIFLNEEMELVSEFVKLTPSEPDFYFYALKRHEQSDEMYTYETKPTDIFSINTYWWTPVHFIQDAQLPRPQSVLLSSLYALRLFFYKPYDELSMWRQAMYAQFFVHLRKYLFPPAVLALKHATEGALFWFEKPLIVDSLLQLLISLCPLQMKRNELFDCIPLFLCWLLEQCDPTATDSDFYQLVTLVDLKSDEKRYFDDPATAMNAVPVPLVMRERAKIPVDAIRHVDIRSFTRYMQNKSNYANISSCKCDDYLIYDPPKNTRVPLAAVSRLTDEQIKQLYATMARKYQPFTLITRGALRSDINDQLVLMQDRTVALLFTRKINTRPKTASSTRAGAVEHVFEIFNPLQHTVGKRQYIGPADLYQLNKNSTQDPLLPEHLLFNVCEAPHTGSMNDASVNAPIQQITVVTLDISRSMFEKPASLDPNDPKTILDMSIIMLGIMCDNIVFGRNAHDVGMIRFGTSVECICPISRNRDDFEKALSIEPKSQEWTCMYDAVNRATTLIGSHERDNKNSIAPNCRKLIICISDGIDNHSSTTIEQLADRLKKYSIVVDFVSFLRDDLLTNIEKEKVGAFRQLCRKTHGYVYQNLPLTNIELGATFEQEAAVWICERESKSFGVVDKPVRRMPDQLHHKATDRVPTNFSQSIQGVSNYTRVLREANNVVKAQMAKINMFFCRNDIFFWKIILSGPSGTPYEGGHWMLYVHFGPQYPRQPPSIRFVTEIFHVNVNADGRVCHHLFDRGWANNTQMTEVFQSILQLLQEPNFDDAVSTEKAQLKRDQPDEYDRQAKECTQQHGSKSLFRLKEEFELED